jgi:hypothetical protein
VRRTAIVGVLLGVGILLLRGRLPRLQERGMAHGEGMLETSTPSRMTRGIEEIRVATTRIEHLLEAGADESVTEAVHGAA